MIYFMDSNKLLFSSLILGLSLIVSAGIGAGVFYKVKVMDQTLSVIGSTKKQVKSDRAKWLLSFSRGADEVNLKAGHEKMARDLEEISVFLKKAGINTKELVVSPILMNQEYFPNQVPGQPKYYNLTQNVEIQSDDAEKIAALSKNVGKLAESGVVLSNNIVEYYYSKLPEARVSLLGDAVFDAKARAEALAVSSGKKVGFLKSASVGVVQVLPVNSVEVSDYGAYDTSHIDKEIMVTVKAVFTLTF